MKAETAVLERFRLIFEEELGISQRARWHLQRRRLYVKWAADRVDKELHEAWRSAASVAPPKPARQLHKTPCPGRFRLRKPQKSHETWAKTRLRVDRRPVADSPNACNMHVRGVYTATRYVVTPPTHPTPRVK